MSFTDQVPHAASHCALMLGVYVGSEAESEHPHLSGCIGSAPTLQKFTGWHWVAGVNLIAVSLKSMVTLTIPLAESYFFVQVAGQLRSVNENGVCVLFTWAAETVGSEGLSITVLSRPVPMKIWYVCLVVGYA